MLLFARATHLRSSLAQSCCLALLGLLACGGGGSDSSASLPTAPATPNQPTTPATPALFKGTVAVVRTDDARTPLALFAKDRSILAAIAGTDPSKLAGAVYSTASGYTVTVMLDAKGRPERATVPGGTVVFGNYKAATVDVAIVAGGKTAIIRDVPLPADLMQEYAALPPASAGSASMPGSSRTALAAEFDIAGWSKAIGLAVSVTSCIMTSGTVVAAGAAVGGPIGAVAGFAVWSVGCTATSLLVIAKLTNTENTELVKSADWISVLADVYGFGAERTILAFTQAAVSATSKAIDMRDELEKGAGSTLNEALQDVNDDFTYSLIITKSGHGAGSVTRSPDQEGYRAGTPVTLTATATERSRFMGWSGACGGGIVAGPAEGSSGGSCTVTIRRYATEVNAKFNALYSLTLQTGGSGDGVITGAKSGELFMEGSSVRVFPEPNAISDFKDWSGPPCKNTIAGDTACDVEMDSDHTLLATFEPHLFRGTFEASYTTRKKVFAVEATCTFNVQWVEGTYETKFFHRFDGKLTEFGTIKGRRIETPSGSTGGAQCAPSDVKLSNYTAGFLDDANGVAWNTSFLIGSFGVEELDWNGSLNPVARTISGLLAFRYDHYETPSSGGGSTSITLR
jgi:hypothetical protein